jgi:hypothetical protein
MPGEATTERRVLSPIAQQQVPLPFGNHVRSHIHITLTLVLTLSSRTSQSRQQSIAASPHPSRTNAVFATPYPAKALSCNKRDARPRICETRWQAQKTRSTRSRQGRCQQDESSMGLSRPSWLPPNWNRTTACRFSRSQVNSNTAYMVMRIC